MKRHQLAPRAAKMLKLPEGSDGDCEDEDIYGTMIPGIAECSGLNENSSPPRSISPSLADLLDNDLLGFDEENVNDEETDNIIPEIRIIDSTVEQLQFNLNELKEVNNNEKVNSQKSGRATKTIKKKINRKKNNTKTKKPKKAPPKKKHNFKWKIEPFKGEAEIADDNFSIPIEIHSPIEYFKLLFDDDILSLFEEQSNLYSTQKSPEKPLGTNKKELSSFVAILLWMGVVPMPAMTDYWSDDLRYDQVANIMPLKRLKKMRSNLHVVDNSEENGGDPYYKIRPLLEKVRKNCLSIEEENRFSVDEMMIAYKGFKSGQRKQYMKAKPKKWGFKMFRILK